MRARTVLSILLCFGLLVACSASEDKINLLERLPADSNGVLHLNSASFELLTSEPRNYAAIVVLTALSPEFGCNACGLFEPNYQLLAKSWLTTKDPKQLYFGQLDVQDGREIFGKLGITTAPYVLFFPATEGLQAQGKEALVYQFHRGLQAEPLAEFLSQQLGTEVPVNHPFDWYGSGLKLLAGVAAILFSYLVFTKFWVIFAKNSIWASIGLVTILMMTSGHMWNQIRGPPYVVSGPKGETQYVVPGQMQQIGAESQIITVLYAACAFSIVILTLHVPKMAEFKQRISVIFFTGLLIVAYSAVIYLFRIKNGGYPFRLLF